MIGLSLTLGSVASISIHNGIDTNVVCADGDHYHDGVHFEAWNSSVNLPTDPGDYYLTSDVIIPSTWDMVQGIRLCLNGHGIKLVGEGSAIVTPSSYTQEMFDCGTNEHKYSIDKNTGLAVVNDLLTSDYETFSGGYITGGNGVDGGGIFVSGGDNAALIMKGGTIIGNKVSRNGGGIAYNWTSKKGCSIELQHVNVIGNYATGKGGGIYYGAPNSGRVLFINGDCEIKYNVSGSKPAGIMSEGRLMLEDYVYIYDNHLLDGSASDVIVNKEGQDDIIHVREVLSDGSKIGVDEMRRDYIAHYFSWNEKDPNEFFEMRNGKILCLKKDDKYQPTDDAGYLSYDITNYDGDYDEQPHYVNISFSDSEYLPEVRYGTTEGKYDWESCPAFIDPGYYPVYLKISRGLNTIYDSSYVSIDKYYPYYIYEPSRRENVYYTGKPMLLVHDGMEVGGTIMYKVGEDGEWTEALASATNVGEYTVYYKIVGDEDHKDTEPKSLIGEILANDKTELNAKISDINSYYESIKDSYDVIANKVKVVLDAAISIANNDNVTKEEIASAVTSLEAIKTEASEDIVKVDDVNLVIDSIGEVTLEKEELINTANEKYLALDDELKPLAHFDTLNAAITKLNDLKAAKAVADLIDLIDEEIVYPDSGDKIKAADNAYKALTSDQQALIDQPHLDKLNNALTTYKDLEDHYKANEVIDLINAIGGDTYQEQIDSILLAKSKYDLLTADQLDLISQELKDKLDAAYNSIPDLINHIKADEVIALIDAIGVVSYPESVEKVKAAKEAYDALTEPQKALIDAEHKQILDNAVILIEALENKAKANEVIDLINAIGEVDDSPECLERIKRARAAYDSLNDEQKALVTNYDSLLQAEKTYDELTHPVNYSLIISLSVVGGVIVLLALTYILMFFAFNKFIKVDDKTYRAIKLGKKDDKIKFLTSSFKVRYADESNVYKSKSDLK